MDGSAFDTDVDRRRFLNRTLIGALSMFSVALGGGSIGLLWPEVREGFGTTIDAGSYDEILFHLEHEDVIYNVEGRFYIVRYDGNDIDGFYQEAGVLAGGLMAIYQKCSHLGCRVPYCPTSKFFECPCHGARFSKAGEWRNGPAGAGMWRFPLRIERDRVLVDTKRPMAQPPMGYDTTQQQPFGEFCVDC